MAARGRLLWALLALAALLPPKLLFAGHRRPPLRPSLLPRRAEVAEEVYVEDPLAAENAEDGDQEADDGDQEDRPEDQDKPWKKFKKGKGPTKPKLKLFRNFNMRGRDLRSAAPDLAHMLSSHVGMVFQLIGDQEEPGDGLTILGRFRGRLEVEATVGGRYADNRPRFNVVAYMDPYEDAPLVENQGKKNFYVGVNSKDKGLAGALERDLANQTANGTSSVAESFLVYRGYQAARQAARALELLRFRTGWDLRIRVADLGGEETLVRVQVGGARRLYPRATADTALMLLSVHVINLVEFQGSNSDALDLLTSMPRSLHAALLFGPGAGNFLLTRGYPLRSFRLKQDEKRRRNLVVEEGADEDEVVEQLHNILNRKLKRALGIVAESPAAGVLALDALRKLQSLTRREYLIVDAAPDDDVHFLVCMPP